MKRKVTVKIPKAIIFIVVFFFVVIAIGFFMTAQIKRLDKMQEEGKKENEYDAKGGRF